MILRHSICIICSRSGSDSTRPTHLTFKNSVFASSFEKYLAVTLLPAGPACITAILLRRFSVESTSRHLFPSSAEKKWRSLSYTSLISSLYTSVSIRFSLRPQLMPSSQASVDGSCLPSAAVFLSSCRPLSFISSIAFSEHFIRWRRRLFIFSWPSTTTCSNPDTASASSLPLFSFFISSRAYYPRHTLSFDHLLEVFVTDWEWPPGWELHVNDHYQKWTALGMAQISALVAHYKCHESDDSIILLDFNANREILLPLLVPRYVAFFFLTVLTFVILFWTFISTDSFLINLLVFFCAYRCWCLAATLSSLWWPRSRLAATYRSQYRYVLCWHDRRRRLWASFVSDAQYFLSSNRPTWLTAITRFYWRRSVVFIIHSQTTGLRGVWIILALF